MVKGVSKTIIEVNNTGSKLFEKIVFYVTPKYGNLSAKQLKRAASNFSFDYEKKTQTKTLRKRYHRKHILFLICSVTAFLSVAGVVLAIIL